MALPHAPFKRGSNSSASGIVARQLRMTELKAIKQSQEDMMKEMQFSHEQIRILQEQLAALTTTLERVSHLHDPNRRE